MFQKYKKIILIAGAIVLLFVVYTVFLKKDAEPVLTTSSRTSALSTQDNELITLLSQLRTIDLDRSIYSNPVFLSLSDFSVVLIPEPISRPNPFAPIGSEGVAPVVQNEDVGNIGAGF